MLPAIVAGLTWLAALAGHVAISTCALNVLYGQAWPRWFLKTSRLLHELWLLIATPWLGWAIVQSGWVQAPLSPTLHPVLHSYMLMSLFCGVVIIPVQTVRRRLRKPPEPQLQNHGKIVDIAAALGHKPIGNGKHRLLAKLPFNEQFQLEILERTYGFDRLPHQWDRLSILHMSDFHFTGTISLDYFEQVIDQANQLDCDLVAITGDLVDRPECHHWIGDLLGKLNARHGRYAILGNHDSWQDTRQIRRNLSDSGFTVLSGRWEQVEVLGQPLIIAGDEMPWMGSHPDMRAAPPDPFKLLLSHTPDNVHWASDSGFDLMLAGHNHGGQVRLPVIGPVYMPSRFGRRYDMGAFQVGSTLMHISRGIAGYHPLRLFCKPDIVKVVLRCNAGDVLPHAA